MKALIDLHTHTIVSGHAYSTVQENIEAAKQKGLKFLGLSEHAPDMPGAPHAYYFHNIKCIPDEVSGVRVLKGIEANIIDFDGKIDVDSDMSKNLDYIIASLHPPCIEFGSIDQNTNAVLNAMKHNKVKVIGHLDDSRYPVDYERVAIAAKEHNIALEVNNSSMRPASFRVGARDNVSVLLKYCKKHEVKIILGSDAHISFDVGNFCFSEEVVELHDFPKELVINYNEEEIIKFLGL